MDRPVQVVSGTHRNLCVLILSRIVFRRASGSLVGSWNVCFNEIFLLGLHFYRTLGGTHANCSVHVIPSSGRPVARYEYTRPFSPLSGNVTLNGIDVCYFWS